MNRHFDLTVNIIGSFFGVLYQMEKSASSAFYLIYESELYGGHNGPQ